MKTVVVLFADEHSLHLFDVLADGKSAYEYALLWAVSVPESCGTVVFACPSNAEQCRKTAEKAGVKITLAEKSSWTVKELLSSIAETCVSYKADSALYSYADCPFLNTALTKEITDAHEKYCAEYTFADGYPYGFAPEALDKGAAAILASLASGTQMKAGSVRVSRNSIFSLIKTDINSFEIETILAPEDWRLYRYEFACGSKAGFMSCAALLKYGVAGKTAAELSKAAASDSAILRTVPAFYNIQLSEKCSGKCTYCPYPAAYRTKNGKGPEESCGYMTVENFRKVVKQASVLSEQAVVSLSAWGEPLSYPHITEAVQAVLAEKGLSVLIETDGLLVTEELCASLKKICDSVPERINGQEKIIWIVSLDGASEETYASLRENGATLARASEAVPLLEKYFPESVYPQMVRMEKNENELEKFWRFWNAEKSPSDGKLIIQKYDSFAGALPQCKPADLSPIERNPCWHLRRDMVILADGSVPLCREFILDGKAGNVFTDGLEKIWTCMTLSENEKCGNCDEYYTFNF